jgi:ribosomal protein L6P/L9E
MKSNIFYHEFKLLEDIEYSFDKFSKNLYLTGVLGSISVDLSPYNRYLKLTLKKRSVVIENCTLISGYNYNLVKKQLDQLCLLLNKTINSVSNGHLIYLNLIGIGYKVWCTSSENLKNEQRVELSSIIFYNGKKITTNSTFLCLKVGYSHQINILIPENLFVFCTKGTNICIYGGNFEKVTGFAAFIRGLRSPEDYKGKGIRLRDEIIKTKPGKKR